MYDILPTIQRWANDERPFVLARVASTWGSAPRRVGSAMAIASDNEFVGSVSGGCVEAAVIEQAADVLRSGKPRLLEFGIDNDRAWSVGLTCGGKIRVLLEAFPIFSDKATEQEAGHAWLDLLQKGERFTVLTWFNELDGLHSLETPEGRCFGEQHVTSGSLDHLDRSELTQVDGKDVFVHVVRGKEVLIIFGATDIAVHLVRLAKQFDFETVVVDPRPAFSESSRFDPMPDEILSAWPDEALADRTISADTYAVLLSHNQRIDDPALHRLLNSEVRYIGALGSRKTQAKRRQRLLESGFSEEEANRIKGPVGLDIGASSPAEIALSIISEIVASRNGAH